MFILFIDTEDTLGKWRLMNALKACLGKNIFVCISSEICMIVKWAYAYYVASISLFFLFSIFPLFYKKKN